MTILNLHRAAGVNTVVTNFEHGQVLDLPKGINISDPVYVKLLQFNTMSVREYFQDITSALYAKSSQVALIISVFRVPRALTTAISYTKRLNS